MPAKSSIMSIRELIDTAFGRPTMNVVNHKLLQTILIILAKQLRLLERRVEVELGPLFEISSSTSISVTEVKLHANVPRKKKSSTDFGPEGGGPGAAGIKMGTKSKTTLHEGSAAKGMSKSSAVSYDKTSSSATKSTTDKSTSDKTSTDKSTSGLTSSTTKSTTDKSSSYKTSTDKTSTDKTSSDKTSTQITSTDQTSSDKTSTAMTSTEKSSSDKTKSTTETTKSSTDATKSSTEDTKSSTDQKTTSSETKTSTDKKTTSSGTKTSTAKTTSSSTKPSLQDYQIILETIEQQREREMRIIHQRTDSREERDKTPTPMTSMDSMEKQYEKLLIVERVPTDGTKATESRSQAGIKGKTPRLSVVTQDEFAELTTVVRQLQDKFKTAGIPGFPENSQLMDDLRKGASLTDAMAALQLSARVEAAEKALEKMMSLVTDLARKTPGIDLEELLAKSYDSDDDKEADARAKAKDAKRKSKDSRKKSIASKAPSKESLAAVSTVIQLSDMQIETEPVKEVVEPEEPKEPLDTVTYEELDNALQELYDECLKMVTTSTSRSNTNANTALIIAHKLEGKLDESLNLGDRMFDLEKIVSEYADQINTLDTGLSSQMTNYQEQLTQMQHDLESGLEAMAEALANTGGDTAAVAELNNHFTNLQTDIDFAATRQKELHEIQQALSLDLQSLWKQIEILRDTKSDRDEVADALKDKAGLGALNGLVSRQEFDAVRGDFEKRIGSAYDKFNNQEIVWQKAIDDLIRELNEKADWMQVVSLQGSINQYLEKFRAKIRAMEEVVGEPRAATVSRKLHRDTACLSCATPAHMDIEVSQTIPALPAFPSRPPAVGAEDTQPKEDGDHIGVCYPGHPVPHAVDSRAHVCHRYCGGSHTLIDNKLSRAPVGMIINPAVRQVTTAVGTDGRVLKIMKSARHPHESLFQLYAVEKDVIKKPCAPCNFKKTTTPEPSEAEPAPVQDEFSSDVVFFDYPQLPVQGANTADFISVTPPPPADDDNDDV